MTKNDSEYAKKVTNEIDGRREKEYTICSMQKNRRGVWDIVSEWI